MQHAVDLIEMGTDPNGEKVQRLIRESSVCTISDRGYDPFAGRTEEEKREWLLFISISSLTDQRGGVAQGWSP
jgi:hypothetical protein